MKQHCSAKEYGKNKPGRAERKISRAQNDRQRATREKNIGNIRYIFGQNLLLFRTQSATISSTFRNILQKRTEIIYKPDICFLCSVQKENYRIRQNFETYRTEFS